MSNMFCVIPAYEPDERLVPLAREAREKNFNVVIVDDGSGDSYKNIFDEAADYAHVISYPKNQGKGHAMKTAFKYIDEQRSRGRLSNCYVVIVDSDGQHKIDDAARLVKRAKERPGALILGSRKQSKDSPLRSRIGNAITRNVFKFMSGVSVYDTQTGMRAFSGELLDNMLSVKGERYEYEMNMLMEFAEKNIPMEEVEIETIYIDNNSASHFNTIKDSWRIYKEIFKFSGSSILAFVVDYSLYTLLNLITKGSAVYICNAVARVISATMNYTINRNLVFHDKTPVYETAPRYIVVALGILVTNTGLLWILTSWFGMNIYLAKILVEIALFIASYTIQKKSVFSGSQNMIPENCSEGVK